MNKWIGHNEKELRRRFDIDIYDPPSGRRQYTIRALDAGTVVLSEDRLTQIIGSDTEAAVRKMLDEAFPRAWSRLSSGDYRIEA